MNRVRSFLVEVFLSYAVYKIDEMYNVQKAIECISDDDDDDVQRKLNTSH